MNINKVDIPDNINRVLYIGDIHGSGALIEFIKKYNNGSTYFYFLGDYFDRGDFSYEVFLVLKELYNSGLASIIIGNHDIFFLYGEGFNSKSSKLYKDMYKNGSFADNEKFRILNQELFFYNGGTSTYNSIKYNADLLGKSYLELYENILDFFYEAGHMYIIDHNNNLLLHGGIPILNNGVLVNILGNYGTEYSGIRYLQLLEKGFKQSKLDILELSAQYAMEKVGRDMYRLENITEDFIILPQVRYLSPLWYDNSMYETTREVGESLRKELDLYNLNYLFVGHWGNKNIFDKEYIEKVKNTRVIRLDKAYDISKDGFNKSFGYAILDRNNNILEIGQS